MLTSSVYCQVVVNALSKAIPANANQFCVLPGGRERAEQGHSRQC